MNVIMSKIRTYSRVEMVRTKSGDEIFVEFVFRSILTHFELPRKNSDSFVPQIENVQSFTEFNRSLMEFN